jgi:endo-1,4-beta-xylanase
MRPCLDTAMLLGSLVLVVTAHAEAQNDNAPAPRGRRTQSRAEWLDPVRDAPNGTKYATFVSKTLGAEASYLVYLPPEYDEATQRYPVIYWLHGLGGNQRAGAMLFVPQVEQAIHLGALPPTIVVLVNGMVSSFYCDWADGKRPVESVIVKDLVPHIDATYRTIARREGRAIEGYSMGGFGAGHLGFKYPDLFGTVVINAGALIRETALNGPNLAPILKEGFANDPRRFDAEHPNELAEKNAEQIRGRTNIRIGVGKDDSLLPRNRELHELLQKLSIDHQYEEVPNVDHNGLLYYRVLGVDAFSVYRTAFHALE